ncbi:N-alpha-acetyltransferase 60 [Plecturocebus cupreus]
MTEVVPSSALSEVSLRLLCHDDIDTVKHLCGDWFPIEYPDSWYRDITSNKKFFSLAATYRGAIVGMIVAEIKNRTKIHKEDGDILASSFSVDTQVAYILSLGVVKEFRKHGIGSLLLESLKDHISTTAQDHCKAIYLHVLTTNNTAINFYENRDFKQHHYLPYYYSIRGVLKDGFTYVLYINAPGLCASQPEPLLHPAQSLPPGPQLALQLPAMVRHLFQEWHRVQPDHVMLAGQPPPGPTPRPPAEAACLSWWPPTGLVGLPQLQARCYTGSGTERHGHAQSVPIPGRLSSFPSCFWKPLPLPVALALPPCPCTVPGADPGLPLLTSLTPLPVPPAPPCKAGGDFVLRGRNTSIVDTLDPKGTGALEQGGAIKGMPGPPPEPAQRSLEGGAQPPLLHEWLVRGEQPGGGFSCKHRALRLSPPATSGHTPGQFPLLSTLCAVPRALEGHTAHRTMACSIQLTC